MWLSCPWVLQAMLHLGPSHSLPSRRSTVSPAYQVRLRCADNLNVPRSHWSPVGWGATGCIPAPLESLQRVPTLFHVRCERRWRYPARRRLSSTAGRGGDSRAVRMQIVSPPQHGISSVVCVTTASHLASTKSLWCEEYYHAAGMTDVPTSCERTEAACARLFDWLIEQALEARQLFPH